ncbi:MAG: cyanophycinase [Pseudomonadota bacterium]|nr:cyanophycinase [Pseudomonadota bacterium]
MPAYANADATPTGSLVIIGGALRADTADVWQRVVALAGGPGATIVVIPAAAEDPVRSGADTARLLTRYGAKPVVLPLAPLWPAGDQGANTSQADMVAQVRAAGGVFFTGGEQYRIVAALRRPDGSNSAVLDAIWALYRRGGVVAGTSAGAAIMSSTMFDQPDETLSVLHAGAAAPHILGPGLGFIGPGVFVDQHFLARGRFGRLLPALQQSGDQLGIGIDENTAIAVHAQREVEVLGESGVIVMDMRHAKRDDQPRNNERYAAAVRGVELSYLERGDRLALDTHTITPSADKLHGLLLNPAAPDYAPVHQAPQYYPDVLGANVLRTLMTELIDNSQTQVVGLAFGMPDAPQPQRGYEFVFRKTAATRGYFVQAPQRNAYTVLGIEMDMAPVTMQRPLYRRLDQ